MYPIATYLFGIAFLISATLAVCLLVRVSELKSKLINTSAESQARLWTMGVLEKERDQFSRISIDQRRAVMEKDEEIQQLRAECKRLTEELLLAKTMPIEISVCLAKLRAAAILAIEEHCVEEYGEAEIAEFISKLSSE